MIFFILDNVLFESGYYAPQDKTEIVICKYRYRESITNYCYPVTIVKKYAEG